MAIDVLALERGLDLSNTPDMVARRPNHRRRWIIGGLAVAVFTAGLGYVTGNEVQANTQIDHAHASLVTTRQHIHAVLADLAAVRRNLSLVHEQVTQASTALTQDAAQLKGMQTALANAEANVSHQTLTIADLQVCLGGVEQASNALAVGDQHRAIDALNAVATSCARVVAANG
ncbi:MAG: hypothetical protein IVW52_19730 [Acidimicrobiales bacterium]|nr:hypothetical protein [Acidimicrobiales bacterium]